MQDRLLREGSAGGDSGGKDAEKVTRVRDHFKMTVLLAVPFAHRGGVISVIQNLAEYLQSQGHRVLLYYPGSSIIFSTQIGSLGLPEARLRLTAPFSMPRPLRSALAFPLQFLIAFPQLIWFLLKNDVHVINVHYPV